ARSPARRPPGSENLAARRIAWRRLTGPITTTLGGGLLLVLHFRWIVLQQLRHSFVEVFLLLLRLGFRIERLARRAAPDQSFRFRVVHVESQLTNVNRGRLAGRDSTAAAVPAASVPARSSSPSGIDRRVFLFRADGRLVPDEQVGGVRL